MCEVKSLYTDGGVILRNPSALGGTWAWCQVNAAGERIAYESGIVTLELVAPLTVVTNNVTEMVALLRGLRSLPDGWSGTVYCDSKISLGRVFWGWRMAGIPENLGRYAGSALKRLGNIRPVLLDGHPTKAQLSEGRGKRGNLVSEHNVFCGAECNRQAKEFLLTANVPVLKV